MKPERLAEIKAETQTTDYHAEVGGWWDEAITEMVDYIQDLEGQIEYHVKTHQEVVQLFVDVNNEQRTRIAELEARVLALTASVEALEAKRQELEGEE